MVARKGKVKVELSYEEQRLANIARNLKELEEIGVNSERNTLRSKVQPKRKAAISLDGLKKKRKPKPKLPKEPVRRSLRQQGKDAEGNELPPDFNINKQRSTFTEEVPERTTIQGNVEVDEDGKVFLETLRQEIKAVEYEGNREPTVASFASEIGYAEKLADMHIDAKNGSRRVTKDRIYSLDVSPVADKTIVAAGDKFGQFGLWAVGSSFGDGGVFSERPHSGTLSSVIFHKEICTKLYTASYDGRMLQFDMEKSLFTEIYNNNRESALYDIEVIGKSLYVSNEDGSVFHLDPNSGKVVSTWELHEKKINTVKFCPNDLNYFATASLDRTCGIWDMRKIKKPLHVLQHDLSINQASWSPNGKYLCTVCMDNTLNIFDAIELKVKRQEKSDDSIVPMRSIRHENRTGRWLTKFKINWDPKFPNAFVIGSMDKPRCIEVFSGSSYKRLMRMRDEEVGSVQSLCVFHNQKNLIATANASGSNV